jgi:transposase
MSRFIRKVKTASGATAVQIVKKTGRAVTGIEHIGSAHSELELDLLLEEAAEILRPGQMSLFETGQILMTESVSSRYLYDTLACIYERLGFETIDDDIFRDLVIARIIEPTSKLDTIRVLSELGLDAPSNTSIHRSLRRTVENRYRDQIGHACFAHVKPAAHSLILYDVTTLYFEAQKEDEYRKSGMSKERRLDPQIVVGLLTDGRGFPLALSSFEGNTAETKTIVPMLEEFKAQYDLDNIVVVADAAMLSGSNLETLESLGYHYIVASRLAKTPFEVEELAKTGPLTDGQIIDTEQGFTIAHKHQKRRTIYQYRHKRAMLDLRNIDKQVQKALRMTSGQSAIKRNRFLSIKGAEKNVNWELVESAKARAGIKGYVTNTNARAADVIAAYHRLFQIEKSFRMSKSDLKARPIFHRTRDSIEAHLTIVFAALAMSHYIQDKTGLSIRKFMQKLRPLMCATVLIDGQVRVARAFIPEEIRAIVRKLD